jgi:cobalamin biosynthesis Mg chelatase CobN
MRVLATSLAATSVFLLQCSIALGLQPGVHVDPSSPAAKQYAIPISSARNEAAGRTGSNVSEAPPAFGVGVTPSTPTKGAKTSEGRAPSTGRHANSETSRGKGAASGAAPSSGSPPAARSSTQAELSASTQETSTGDGGWLALILGGALVLVLGGVGGLMLRRRLS